MVESGVVDADDGESPPGQRSQAVLASVTDTLFGDESFSFDESVVKGTHD
jgi:hypothetical protein